MSTPEQTSTRAADMALLSVAVVWGGSYLAARSLTHIASPACVMAMRFIPSLAVFLVIMAARRSWPGRRTWAVGLLFGALQTTTLFLETTAVTHTSATNAGVLVCLAVVIAPAVEGAIARSRLPGAYYLATITSLVGVALLIGPSNLTRPNPGDLMVLCAACTRAGLMVASAHLTRGHAFDAVALTGVQTLVTATVATIAAGSALPGAVRRLDVHHLLVLAFISLGCTCAAFGLQLWGIHHTSASRASLLMGTEPVWALVIGVSLGGDRLGVVALVGAVIVLAATVWGQRIERRWRLAALPV